MTIKITERDTLKLLKKAVKRKGEDYCYKDDHTECVYVDNNGPSCLIGHVLDIAGVDLKSSLLGSRHNRLSIATMIDYGPLDVVVDEDAIAVLRTAQWAQDNGKTWGEAYDRAKAKAKSLKTEKKVR